MEPSNHSGLHAMELTASQMDLLDIFNLSSDLLTVSCARTGKFLQVNDSFAQLLGHSKETLLTSAFLDFVHPDDVEATSAIASHMDEGSLASYFFENRYKTSTGSFIPIAWRGREKNGKFYSTGKDISSFRENATLLNDIQQLTKTGSWVLRANDLALTWTEETYLIHGLRPGTPVDLEMAANFFLAGDKINFRTGVYRCLTSRSSFDGEFRIVDSGGNTVWVRCTCKCILNHDNTVLELRGTMQDISTTKNKELLLRKTNENLECQKILLAKESELAAVSERANAEKNQFLANISHEMRTPLAAIIGFVDLIHSDPRNSEEYLSIIARNATHLSTLVDDVLDLCKVEAGQLTLDMKNVDLLSEVDDAIALLQLQAEHKGLIVRKLYDRARHHLVKTDPMRLRQILNNIIANAIKFTHTGFIDIDVSANFGATHPSKTDFVISITDTGCGIASDMHELIFERFHQGSPSTTRKYGGTGLGLALSRKITTLLGGRLVCRQSTIGGGSTFELTLSQHSTEGSGEPLADMPQKTTALSSIPELCKQMSLAGVNILVIDDESDIRLLLTLLLQSLGAKIESAENGAVGVRKALEFQYHAIIMDIKMPVMDGKIATIKIREAGLLTPIIALSADATKEEKRLSFAAGVNEYCSKPITQEELHRVVSKWAKAPVFSPVSLNPLKCYMCPSLM
jgi:PAS domain S-box-containing protein